MLKVSASEIVLRAQSTDLPMPWADARREAKPDSNLNGALIGALGGGVATALIMRKACWSWDCSSKETRRVALMGALFGGLGGMAIGATVDLLTPGRRVVYESPGLRTIAIAPILARDQRGVAVMVRW